MVDVLMIFIAAILGCFITVLLIALFIAPLIYLAKKLQLKIEKNNMAVDQKDNSTKLLKTKSFAYEILKYTLVVILLSVPLIVLYFLY